MRKEKTLLLDEIKDKIDDSKAIIITSYSKLEPNASWILRDLLGKSESQFEVVKKRLFLKAAELSNIQVDPALLEGHVGVVFVKADDLMPSTKVVFKFSEENGKVLQVLVGQMDGRMVPGTELEMLSKLPGIDEMRAGLLALFVSPMTHTLSVMEAAIAGPLAVIKEKSESKDLGEQNP